MGIKVISDKNAKLVWVKSRSGVPVTISNSREQLNIGKDWISLNPTSSLMNTILKMNKYIAVSETNPIVKKDESKVLKKLSVSKESIDLAEGDSAELVITPEPNIPFPSQLISISEILSCASTAVKDNTITVTAHKAGSTFLTHRSGNVECTTKVNVYPIPEFIKKYYEGKVGEPVTLAIKGQNTFNLTCPEGMVQKGNTVVAEKPGKYDVVASILGKTISTTINVVGEPEVQPQAPVVPELKEPEQPKSEE